ncbi:MAG: hypothetical protein AB8B61_00385 [Cyclobacteriaceae bacterium]
MLDFIQKKGLYLTLGIAVVIIAGFYVSGSVSFIIGGAVVLLVIGILIALVLPILSAIKDPKTIIKAVIGVAAITIFFLIGYAVSNDLVLNPKQTGFISPDGAKFSGGVLNATYILVVIAVLTVLAGPFLKRLSK